MKALRIIEGRLCALAGLILMTLASASLAAEPIPLPGKGSRTANLQPDRVRLNYDANNRQLSFSGVTSSNSSGFSKCEATLAQGKNSSQLSPQNWGNARKNTAVDWHIIIDQSESMRIRKSKRVPLKEAIALSRTILSKLGSSDTVAVYLVSTEMEKLGSCEGSRTQNLSDKLKGIKTGRSKEAKNQKTAIFHLTHKLIRDELNKQSLNPERRRAILFLTDGEDDASPTDAHSYLTNSATDKQLPINICCVVFGDGTAVQQINTFEQVSGLTGGFFHQLHTAPNESTNTSICSNLLKWGHCPSYNFSFKLPEFEESAQLKVTLQPDDGSAAATLSLSPEALNSVINSFPAPDNQPPTPEQQAISYLVAGINAANNSLGNIEKEEGQPTPPNNVELSKHIWTLRKQLDTLAEQARKLKEMPADKVKSHLSALQKAKDCSEQKRNILQRINTFCEDSTIPADKVTPEHMLKLIGREKALPTPEADTIQKLITAIGNAEAAATALAQAEKQHIDNYPAIEPSIKELQKKAAGLLPLSSELKRMPADVVKKEIEKALAALKPEEPQHAILTRLQTLCNNTELAADQLAEEHMLALLGRSTPLPVAPIEQPTPAWVLWSSGGGAAVILILVFVFISAAHKKKLRKEEDKRRLAAIDRAFTCAANATKAAEETQQIASTLPAAINIALNASEAAKEAATMAAEAQHSLSADAAEEAARQAQAAEQIATEQAKEAAAMKRDSQRDKVVVEAGAPGVSPQSVLAVLNEPETGKQWWILAPLISVGRNANNDLVYRNNMTLSKVHCTISRDGNGNWFAIDQSSTNGVICNGRKYVKLPLSPNGTGFQIGSIKLVFFICNNSNNDNKTHVYKHQ